MDSFSPKVVFYLQNRPQIEEWAQLQPRAENAFNDWLSTWETPLKGLIESLDDSRDVQLFTLLGGSEPSKLFLFRSSWKRPEAGSTEHPEVGIGFQWWHDKQPLLRESSRSLGVWVNRIDGQDRNEGLYKHIDKKKRDGVYRNVNRWWPVRLYMQPVEDIFGSVQIDPDWDPEAVTASLNASREAALRSLRTMWGDYAPIVDEAVREAGLPFIQAH